MSILISNEKNCHFIKERLYLYFIKITHKNDNIGKCGKKEKITYLVLLYVIYFNIR